MKLNKAKCEVLLYGGHARVAFQDRTCINVVQKAKYLGCILNKKNDPIVEVRGRIREAMGTLKRMHVFWRHSNCNIRLELNVVQAVLYSKVLFGLESAELQTTALKSLDVFQLKCLRQILKMRTTCVERGNTNLEVFKRAMNN